jgi:hypothetical protein
MINSKLHHGLQKTWFFNMNNIVVNYLHMGEDNDMYLVHMNKKCRIDRLGGVSRVWRF